MMNAMAVYGLIVVALTLFVQWLIASGVKAKAPDAIPGKIDSQLGPSSFVFRAHRTFMNSLENLPLFFFAVLIAYFSQAHAIFVAGCIWTFAIARIVYTLWYYAIATQRNPSGRSAVFMIGLLANLVLLIGSVFWV